MSPVLMHTDLHFNISDIGMCFMIAVNRVASVTELSARGLGWYPWWHDGAPAVSKYSVNKPLKCPLKKKYEVNTLSEYLSLTFSGKFKKKKNKQNGKLLRKKDNRREPIS